jgi:hypothetical protein
MKKFVVSIGWIEIHDLFRTSSFITPASWLNEKPALRGGLMLHLLLKNDLLVLLPLK